MGRVRKTEEIRATEYIQLRPDGTLYIQIKDQAERNLRSINKEVVAILRQHFAQQATQQAVSRS